MQRSPLLPALAAGLLVTACAKAPSAEAPAQLPEVTVAKPLAQRIIEWDDYVGQFRAVQSVDVRPRVSGYVVGVHFEDGELVKKGQPLFTVDPRPFRAALAQAQADADAAEAKLENARSELDRIRDLADKKLASKEQLDAREADLRTAKAQLEAARAAVQARRLDLGFTEISSPIDGRVSYRRVDQGNAVKADDTVLTTIVSVDPIYFEFQGSEALYLKYKREEAHGSDAARKVRIRLQDEKRPRWTGRLVFMDNTIDPSSGTIRGRALVDNPEGFLTPGMFGHMQLQASERHAALLLPDTAIGTQGAERIVYVVGGDGLVATRKVVLGPLHDGLRVVRSGLEADDRVVVDGQQRARPGARVSAKLTQIHAPAGEARASDDGDGDGNGDGNGDGDGDGNGRNAAAPSASAP